MRQALVMGNWKLNATKASVEALINGLVDAAKDNATVEVAVCPPAVFIPQVEALTADTAINYGAQDCDVNTAGAFTGENSAVMLKEFGCKYTLVGHSERRVIHGESSEVVADKFAVAQENGLVPVLCIGETLEQFEAGETKAVVEAQLQAVVTKSGIASLNNAVIAYEPVWAIGTGKTATPEIAQDIHAHIRSWLAEQDAAVANKVQILYGGSVKGANAAELFGQADIDGGLVGGASLDAVEFSKVIAGASA
ncbi:triose-phosphate isomerase [Moritella viscosa]|uniref:Triosephosphate isomerase n=1 Tax=Moritella viscosa TaxID=80854 RepID=A0ABY1HLI3_9GAMM|nr:triose-phosphate isomerase [Moritella viscosa]SGZ00939.1 Triosephosphate isomerase-Triose-phosphate isomerase [Moritella viscosa]SGZ02542.1 Triosephosphate isomerase-Triose-phosphate isomerase [Moritella viscosa]SGZ03210.1 Triosephosphate isomerase-Triose-phosphate isomerase [Moritella viscosa]SGZ15849.1 Triosephosphate isomerase-Triose-phosphate isomerase [Moritella viscosa]SHO28736.1 Triosephosphate isomerase-Triose-phosphate isomerase [Moritella viscosa]